MYLHSFFYTMFMKTILITVILSAFLFQSNAQKLQARYSVSREIFMTVNNKATKVADAESSAFFYRDNNRYIYFEKPDYLQKYPDGLINVNSSDAVYSYQLPVDTIQKLYFHDLDSLVVISRPLFSAKGKVDFNIKDKVGRVKFNIEYLDENKQINGLYCQKANLKIGNNLQWIVWFAPSIPVDVGIYNIINLPGLVVEAEMIPLKTKYILQKYNTGAEIDEKIFHPQEFSDRYESPFGTPINKITDKTNKQSELINSN